MMESIEYFIQKRGNACESCHRSFTYLNPPERHHALIRRSKRYPELDYPVNIEIVCHECHASGKVDTHEHKVEFAHRQIARGYNVMEWVESLPLKIKENWLLNL